MYQNFICFALMMKFHHSLSTLLTNATPITEAQHETLAADREAALEDDPFQRLWRRRGGQQVPDSERL